MSEQTHQDKLRFFSEWIKKREWRIAEPESQPKSLWAHVQRRGINAAELEEFCRSAGRGKVSEAELCQFVDRLWPDPVCTVTHMGDLTYVTNLPDPKKGETQ